MTGPAAGGDTGRIGFTSAGAYGLSVADSAHGADTPSLDPVPQELSATIEARFTATGVSLPES
jgi:hypothetical protein